MSNLAEYRALVDFGEAGSVEAYVTRLVNKLDHTRAALMAIQKCQSLKCPHCKALITHTLKRSEVQP